MISIKRISHCTLLMACLLMTTIATAGTVALEGYDTVAYFTEGKAVQGNEDYSLQWNGFTWYFASEKNRDLFAATPEKYAPQYNGYCSWGMTEGRKVLTDPEIWKIVDGKLYLNCSKEAQEKWSEDIPGNIRKADAEWKKLKR